MYYINTVDKTTSWNAPTTNENGAYMYCQKYLPWYVCVQYLVNFGGIFFKASPNPTARWAPPTGELEEGATKFSNAFSRVPAEFVLAEGLCGN